MKDCALVKQFLENKRKYLVYKHQDTAKYNKEREQKVIKFLQYACTKDIVSIQDIDKTVLIDFMRSIKSKSLETQRKYRLAIAEFIERAGLGFRIAKNIDRQKEKKFLKIKHILEKHGFDISQYKREIMQVL